MYIENCREKAFFASSNSYRGFQSDYDEIYAPEKHTRVFVLKGGSGTGKSSLMKKIRQEIGEKCDKLTTYYCSSDPASLDGIVCEKEGRSVAVIDGTAPHVRDAKIPGAFDETVDLAAFLSAEDLVPHRKEIHTLTEKKAAAFRLGYRYLDGAGILFGHAKALLRTALKKEKVERCVKRILREVGKNGYACESVLTDGVGMRGLAHFDTLEKEAKIIYLIDKSYGFSTLFLECAVALLERMDVSYIRAKSPFSSAETVAILFPEEGILLIAEDYSKMDKSNSIFLNYKRFIDKFSFRDIRSDVRKMRKTAEDLLCSAIAALGSAGEYHFAIEEHYIAAMDFNRKEAFSEELLRRISSILFPDLLLDKNNPL